MTHDLSAAAPLADFLSRCAHDLRAPLAAIQGYLGLLACGQAGLLTDRQRAFLTASQQQQELMHRRLEVFFVMSGYLTGAWPMRCERIDLATELARYAEEQKHSSCPVAVSLHPHGVQSSVQAMADTVLLDHVLDMLVPLVAATGGDLGDDVQLGCLKDSDRAWITLSAAGRHGRIDDKDMAVPVALLLLDLLDGILECGSTLEQDTMPGSSSSCRIGLPQFRDAASCGSLRG